MGIVDEDLLEALLRAATVGAVEALIQTLPIADPNENYMLPDGTWSLPWRDGQLHWTPVGRDRGNSGRIKLAGNAINPIAERLVNGMEACIELERLRELHRDPAAAAPMTPREAVRRYFDLPRLDDIPLAGPEEQRRFRAAVAVARAKLSVRLLHEDGEFTVTVRDHGMGQSASRVHETLLSLGRTDKGDKGYLIGLFGQGGSSAFSASEYSIVMSRRAADISNGERSLGWSIVKQLFPKGRRDPYFAYLANAPDGSVPNVSAEVADQFGFDHGSQFSHIRYDFGSQGGSAVSRVLYQSLNHVLFNPMLPYDLFAIKDTPDLMQGTAYRLARRAQLSSGALDKSFPNLPVGAP